MICGVVSFFDHSLVAMAVVEPTFDIFEGVSYLMESDVVSGFANGGLKGGERST